MCALRRNLAAAERTLQKSLAAVKDGGGGNVVRPHLRCQLAGTLADIIARSEQAAGSTGKPRPEAAGRLTEIVDLLRFAFEVLFSFSGTTSSLSMPRNCAGDGVKTTNFMCPVPSPGAFFQLSFGQCRGEPNTKEKKMKKKKEE